MASETNLEHQLEPLNQWGSSPGPDFQFGLVKAEKEIQGGNLPLADGAYGAPTKEVMLFILLN